MGDQEKLYGSFSCCCEEDVDDSEWRKIASQTGSHPPEFEGVDNAVFTAKYNAFTFVPRGLFEQFRRMANIYFLVLSVLMILGEYADLFYTPLTPWTTLLPLCAILAMTLAKEAVEDLKRHNADHATNNKVVQRLEPSSGGGVEKYSDIAWKDVHVGMVLRIEDRQEIPADLVPLLTSEEESKCFIETANIDGETNLKLKRCATRPGAGVSWADARALAAAEGLTVETEPPNASVHSFKGTLKCDGESISLDEKEMLLRGAVLRNTKWILGFVVYTGKESKLILNARQAPSKLSMVEDAMNKMIYVIFFADFVLTTLTTIAHAVWDSMYDDELWYVCEGEYEDSGDSLFAKNCSSDDDYANWLYWFTFVILYNNFIPISLYVTVEMINLVQAFFVDNDLEMYDDKTDTPALARTSNMNGDLGQIEYIFSDKTGTLTCNEMKFQACTVCDEVYGHFDVPEEGSQGTGDEGSQFADEWVRESMHNAKDLSDMYTSALEAGPSQQAAVSFLEILSVCHTVVVEQNEETGEKSYQAESPDEEALVEGAKLMGWTFESKGSDTISVRVSAPNGDQDGELRVYTVLAVIEFNSTRKRMSALIQTPDGVYKLLSKGADNIMFDLSDDWPGRMHIDQHLEFFASQGLRTLVLCERVIDDAFANQWLQSWKEASESQDDRASALAKVAAEIEQGLTVVGATAIEDRLQDDVPETIADLRESGIKVWVLTGDKMATAINIAYSCKLLVPDMAKIMIKFDPTIYGDDEGKAQHVLEDQLDKAAEALDKQLTKLNNHFDRLGFVKNALHWTMQHIGCDDEEGKSSMPPPTASSSSSLDRSSLPDPLLSAEEKEADGDFSPRVSRTIEQMNSEHVALIVDGPSLFTIFKHPKMKAKLLRIACFCRVVVACRVSPKQKQLIVDLIQTGLARRPVTLAIGDGANDVGMIQEAQIGVGISGHEGRQAVNNSDFAIAQFKFLKRLLIVHGRWNYRRISKVIVYSFHKNIVLTIILAFWTFNCALSGQSLYEAYVYTGFNFFLGVPILLIGFFDQDLSDKVVMANPGVYSVGREKRDMNPMVMAMACLRATVEAVLLYYLCYLCYTGGAAHSYNPAGVWGWTGRNGEADLYAFGLTVYSAMLFGMLVKVAIMHYTWNLYSVAGMIFSFALYFGFLFSYGSIRYLSYDFVWVVYHTLSMVPFWLLAVLLPTIIGIVDALLGFASAAFFSDHSDLVRFNEHERQQNQSEHDTLPEDGVAPATISVTQNPLDRERASVRKSDLDMLHTTTSEEDRRDMGIVTRMESSYTYDHVDETLGADKKPA